MIMCVFLRVGDKPLPFTEGHNHASKGGKEKALGISKRELMETINIGTFCATYIP